MAECIDKNMCDKDKYPQTAEIESRCVHILADLWNSQDLIERVIYAATRASTPGNSQEWDFIVVRNPEAKRKIQELLAPRGDGRASANNRAGHQSNDSRRHPSGGDAE